jgi:fused signal recognition particle receptor
MALGFIKKVFSFGRSKEAEAPQPAPEETAVPQPAPEPVAPKPLPAAERVEAVALERPALTSPKVEPEPQAGPAATPVVPQVPPAPEPAPTETSSELSVPAEDDLPAATSEAEPEAVKPESRRTEEEAPPALPEITPAEEPATSVYEAGEPAAERQDASAPPAPAPQKPAEASPAPTPAESPAAPRASWFQRLRQGLSRSSAQITGQITGIFTKRKLDEDTLQDLEDVLIQADLGVETAMRVTDTLASGRYGKNIEAGEVSAILAGEIEKVLAPVARPLELDLSHRPHVVLVVGVNGTGKTTTIGKLAAKLSAGGMKVTLAAGDTFRAAAIEQLKIWGERTGSEVVASKLGADAAGLAYDAFERAKANGSDVLIIDTAGRLQNKAELMAELEKVVRVLGKHDPDAPHTVLQTLDATTGQNALNQVEIFKNVAGVNGLVMTKLDGSARGGILVAIAAKHKLPVYFIGVGEGIDDLEPFEAKEFAAAIAGLPAAR